jgi:hypothetical protein
MMGVAVGDPDELLRLGERQGLQNQRVDDAENRDAGPDAEAGDQDRKGGESRVATRKWIGNSGIVSERVIVDTRGLRLGAVLARARYRFDSRRAIRTE